MRQISLRLAEETIDVVDAEAETNGITRSEHVRNIIRSRHETGDRLGTRQTKRPVVRPDHWAEIDDLERHIEDLQEAVTRLEADNADLLLDRATHRARAMRFAQAIPTEAGSFPTREVELPQV